MLLAMFAIQWNVLVEGYIELLHEHGSAVGIYNHQLHHLDVTTLIKADFCAASVLISMGGVLGKLTHSQMLFMAFFEVIFYSINQYIVFVQFLAIDMGGSIVIHMFGAYFGLAVSYVVTDHEKLKRDEKNQEPTQ